MIRRTLLFFVVAGLALGASAGSVAFAGSSDDEDIAESSVLTEDDVTDYGLEETNPTDDTLPPNTPECKKIRALDKAADSLPSAITEFTDEAGTTATSKVVIYPSVKRAQAPIRAYASDDGADCIGAILDEGLQENLDPDSTYEFDGESIDPELGDNSIVYQITITVTDADGNESEVYLEVGLVQVANGLAQLSFQAPDAPFDGSEDLATIVVDNLTSNLDS